MIPHRLTLVVWFVLVLLAGRAVDGKTETLPSADADRAINHTGDTRPPDASFGYFAGRIEQDATWCGTVYVGGDVTIAAAATLTLAPDTQVLFLPYHDETRGGLDSTRAELIIEGRLAAQAGGIVFRSADAGSLGAGWYGLVVERGGIADVSNATIRDGLRCVYAKRGGRVTMDSIAFANCGKPTAPEDAASLSMSRRSAQPLPALRVAEKTDRQRSKRVDRVAGKLLVGTLVGSAVLGGAAVSLGTFIRSDTAFAAAFWVGYPVGVGLGASLLDRHDYSRSLVFSIGGSFLGTGIGLALVHRYRHLHPLNFIGIVMIVPPITATLVSELFRRPLGSGRFSVSLVPDVRGNWSAVATLRF